MPLLLNVQTNIIELTKHSHLKVHFVAVLELQNGPYDVFFISRWRLLSCHRIVDLNCRFEAPCF